MLTEPFVAPRPLTSPPMARSFSLLKHTLKKAAIAAQAQQLRQAHVYVDTRALAKTIRLSPKTARTPIPIPDNAPIVMAVFRDEEPSTLHVYRSDTDLMEPFYNAEVKSDEIEVRESSGALVGIAHVIDDEREKGIEVTIPTPDPAYEDSIVMLEAIAHFPGDFIVELPAGNGLFYWTSTPAGDIVMLDANGLIMVRMSTAGKAQGELGRIAVYGHLKRDEGWVDMVLVSVLGVLEKGKSMGTF